MTVSIHIHGDGLLRATAASSDGAHWVTIEALPQPGQMPVCLTLFQASAAAAHAYADAIAAVTACLSTAPSAPIDIEAVRVVS